MGIFQQFPYSNFHEMNLDQIIKIMRQMQDEWAATKTEWASYKEFIDNYFENLDVSEEVLQAMRTMAASGELAPLMDPTIATETAAWLTEHITQPTTPVVDTSLSVAGAAADAKATGDAINDLNIATHTYVLKANPGSTVFKAIPVSAGTKLLVENRTSGLINCSINAGNTPSSNILFNIGNMAAGTVDVVTIDTAGSYFRAYCGGATVSNELIVVTDITNLTTDQLGITEHHAYVASGSGVGRYWNIVMDKEISAGDVFVCKLSKYSGSLLQNIAVGYIDSGNYIRLGNTQQIGEYFYRTVPVDVSQIYLQLIRSSAENNVYADCEFIFPDTTGLSRFMLEDQFIVKKYYTCLKDGTGDFNAIVGAINALNEQKIMDATLYVGPGVWDICDEFGAAFLNTIGSSNRGLYLKNNIHVICSSDALITCNYTGTRAETIQWLSAFNAGEYGFTLENARIESSKCRYSVHDERDTQTDDYTNKYINCSMKHDNTNGGYAQCIGGGLGKNGHIIIDGCIFENPNVNQTGIVSYHNTWYDGGDGRSLIDFKGCYVKGTNTFKGSWFGASQEITTFLVHDNSLGAAPIHVVENQSMMDDNPTWIQNTEMLAWNNEVRQ